MKHQFRHMLKHTAVLLLSLAGLLLLTGCGDKATLDSWCAEHRDDLAELEGQQDAWAETLGGTVTHMQNDHMLIFVCTLSEEVDPSDDSAMEALTAACDAAFDDARADLTDLRDQIRADTGRTDIGIRLAILNADSSDLYYIDLPE